MIKITYLCSNYRQETTKNSSKTKKIDFNESEIDFGFCLLKWNSINNLTSIKYGEENLKKEKNLSSDLMYI